MRMFLTKCLKHFINTTPPNNPHRQPDGTYNKKPLDPNYFSKYYQQKLKNPFNCPDWQEPSKQVRDCAKHSKIMIGRWIWWLPLNDQGHKWCNCALPNFFRISRSVKSILRWWQRVCLKKGVSNSHLELQNWVSFSIIYICTYMLGGCLGQKKHL